MSGDDKKINDEKNVTSRTEAFKNSSNMLDAEIALDIVDDDGNKGDGASKSDNQSETSSEQGQQHSKYIWLHAFYHSIVTMIGTGILGFPYATSYLGWYGGKFYSFRSLSFSLSHTHTRHERTLTQTHVLSFFVYLFVHSTLFVLLLLLPMV